MSDSESTRLTPPVDGDKKRKRKSQVPSDEELEIDVNLPEPPSKKAKRLEKKKAKREKAESTDQKNSATKSKTDGSHTEDDTNNTTSNAATAKRSEYGIWIGNLPWSATKDSLRQFLTDNGPIDDKDITRLHMPAPADKPNPQQAFKPQNKGFAYVDFRTPSALTKALALSEKLLVGRRVLIKNAKSFEGRPDKTSTEAEAEKASAKPATNRIFVGNLDFTITQDELLEHYSQAGEVKDVHVATFEDSGKCKGYAWVRFVDIEAAEAAVRGYIFKKAKTGDDGVDDDGDQEEAKDAEVDREESEKKPKKVREKKQQKWFINRLHGRPLRCEFAEDAQTRFKKRFGKDDKRRENHEETGESHGDVEEARQEKVERAEPVKPLRRDAPWVKKRDARKIAPGKALASAPRSTAAIVASAGKKVTFD